MWLPSAGSSRATVKFVRPSWLWTKATALHSKSRPAILSVLQLPDINANKSVSGSGDLVSFETKITGRVDCSATDEVAEKTAAVATTCQRRRRTEFRPGMDGSAFVKFDSINETQVINLNARQPIRELVKDL